ncbi:VOC family protein [Pedobacter miscanthi]|uniref:VOC family protein n=1 Tax=Pedobacter miscanthi TaxID=2259170 RepID=A0A366KYR8_9SPHI|nr:VOC family protein [Pedobacter miscanthi]RBQ06660.1 VOC family protein [Pedobacter miscanthi]
MRKLAFASLQVRDLDLSKDFYTNKLGFEIAVQTPEACVFSYKQGDASFAIRKPMINLEGKELGVGTSLWFAIDGNIEDLREQFTAAEVEMLGSINTTPFGKTLIVKDPDGYNITFLQAN